LTQTAEPKPKIRAAQYMFRARHYARVPTVHQQHSSENHAVKIKEFAEAHGMAIVRTYSDQGKSGLSTEGRTSRKELIADVKAGDVDFTVILVYDVSRWGRFQEMDESAYYEKICRRAGIQVAYYAEQVEYDAPPIATVLNSVKRAMAAEYKSMGYR